MQFLLHSKLVGTILCFGVGALIASIIKFVPPFWGGIAGAVVWLIFSWAGKQSSL